MSKEPLKKKLSIFIKQNFLLHSLFQFILYFLLKILFFTYKISVSYSSDNRTPINKMDGIFYFWHQNILSGMYFFYTHKCKGYCIVSPSKDGKFAGFICQKLGFNVLYGSSYKSSITLLKNILSVLTTNKQLCIVGDGSRGPAFSLKNGIIKLAEKSNLPLIFVECKPSSTWTLKKSWDQFQIPRPFSTIFITLHKPKYYPQTTISNK